MALYTLAKAPTKIEQNVKPPGPRAFRGARRIFVDAPVQRREHVARSLTAQTSPTARGPGASLAPYLAQILLQQGGLPWVGYYVSSAAIISFFAVLSMKRTG